MKGGLLPMFNPHETLEAEVLRHIFHSRTPPSHLSDLLLGLFEPFAAASCARILTIVECDEKDRAFLAHMPRKGTDMGCRTCFRRRHPG